MKDSLINYQSCCEIWQQRRTLITEQGKTLKDLKNRSILLKNETFKTVDSEIQNNKPEEILAGKNFLT